MDRVHLSPPSAKARVLDSRISNYASVGEQGSAKARGDDPRISIYASRGRHQPVEPAANTPLTLLGQKGVGKIDCRRSQKECRQPSHLLLRKSKRGWQTKLSENSGIPRGRNGEEDNGECSLKTE